MQGGASNLVDIGMIEFPVKIEETKIYTQFYAQHVNYLCTRGKSPEDIERIACLGMAIINQIEIIVFLQQRE